MLIYASALSSDMHQKAAFLQVSHDEAPRSKMLQRKVLSRFLTVLNDNIESHGMVVSSWGVA
jgi:hypothetical protein